MSGNEASAIGSLRAITSAQADYNALNRAYASSLVTLSTASAQVAVLFIAAYPRESDALDKSGYLFTIAGSTTPHPLPVRSMCAGALL
jgi:hypothetical protein